MKVDRFSFGNDNMAKIYEYCLSTIIPHGKTPELVGLHVYPFNPFPVYYIGLSSASSCFCKRLVCIISMFFGPSDVFLSGFERKSVCGSRFGHHGRPQKPKRDLQSHLQY